MRNIFCIVVISRHLYDLLDWNVTCIQVLHLWSLIRDCEFDCCCHDSLNGHTRLVWLLEVRNFCCLIFHVVPLGYGFICFLELVLLCPLLPLQHYYHPPEKNDNAKCVFALLVWSWWIGSIRTFFFVRFSIDMTTSCI